MSFKLRQLLNAYHPASSYEQQIKERMHLFMDQYPNCFERSLEIGHFTASAWLLDKAGTHVLLMHHAKLDMWVQLGGHCDGNSNVLEVALQEAQEESGINGIEPVLAEIFDIDIHKVPEYNGIPAHEHYDVRFLLRVNSDEQIAQNSESKELRWIPAEKDQLPTDEPSVVRMFDKWVIGQRGQV